MPTNLKILSLGDSYTIGQSVCEKCNFPTQLKDSINLEITDASINLEIIAVTGWTTTSLLNSVNPIFENSNENINFFNNDLVTLLIGVNNQFEKIPFSIYKDEFPDLVNKAILLADKDPNKVIVISIPDYSYTPSGQSMPNPNIISNEIDLYNSFAENYCVLNKISFINITEISRLGLQMPELVAQDNLHLSEIAYKKFVERIYPTAIEKIIND